MIQWNHSFSKLLVKVYVIFPEVLKSWTHRLKHSYFYSPVCGYRRHLILASYRNTWWKSSPYHRFRCFHTKQCSKPLFYWMIYTHNEMLKKCFCSHQTMINHHTEAEFGLVLCQMLGARWADSDGHFSRFSSCNFQKLSWGRILFFIK